MSIDDELRLERYKIVTDRQKYFTDLAKEAFASYMKVFTGLTAGGIALISAKTKLELSPKLLEPLIDAIVYLITFLGIMAIGQIIFCLVRWIGYRRAECSINPDSPPIVGWWWIFESLYCVAIAVSIIAIWIMNENIIEILKVLPLS